MSTASDYKKAIIRERLWRTRSREMSVKRVSPDSSSVTANTESSDSEAAAAFAGVANNKVKDNGQKYGNGTGSDYKQEWLRYPYGVKLQEDPRTAFKCIADYEKFVLEGDSSTKTINEYGDIVGEYDKILKSDVNSDFKINGTSADGGGSSNYGIASSQPEIDYFQNPEYTDSRIGCNDAMNPLWQFNRDDDIRPLMLTPKRIAAQSTLEVGSDDAVNDVSHACGMGRIYAETYDDNQQILWLEAGVPRFSNILDFYRDAADVDVSQAINTGTLSHFAGKAVISVIKGAVWAISLPVLAPFYLSRWIDLIAQDRITKYYSFQPTMTMYYETVNSMLQYVAIGMGIHPFSLKQHNLDKGASHVQNGEDYARITDEAENVEYGGIPDILKNGPDIFKIMNRRSQMVGLNNAEISTRELLQKELEGKAKGENIDSNFLPEEKPGKYENDHWALTDGVLNWYGALKGSLFGSGNHIGFRIERGVDASESFSNSTGQTGIAQKLNSISSKYREENESFGNSHAEKIMSKGIMGLAEGEGVGGFVDTAKAELTKMVGTTLSELGGFDIGSVLMTGNGFLDIPEVWRNSSFQKLYNFNIQLRSRYGDPVSIFQSIYIPMLMLLALSAPRAIGTNMYTSPFIVRAYCRGMFSIPLGIVENITIKRGRDEMGWSNMFLPTAVDVSFSIKDLSPTLFLSMQDNGIFDTFSRNSNLLEYLDTLAALGLKERAFLWPKLMRKFKTVLAVSKSTVFSATYYGTRLGRSNVGRAINALMVPFKNDRTPNN